MNKKEQKLTLAQKIEKNEEILGRLEVKLENLELQVQTLRVKILNQKKALSQQKSK